MSSGYDGVRRELFEDDIQGISHIYHVARITSITPLPNGWIQMVWRSHPARAYQVMWTDDIDSGWQPATGFYAQQQGTGSNLVFFDDGITTYGDTVHATLAPAVKQRFYRIEALVTTP